MSDNEFESNFLSEQSGVSSPPAARKVRPLAVIEAELDMLKHDTRQKETALLCNYIEFGRRLVEAKAQLVHGQWGEWLKKMEIGQSTANNFMRLFREYGSDQQSLFGGVAKSQTFGNLTYSKALQLLALPDAEERERFITEHDVASMSTRELERAIKERDAAQEEAAAAKENAQNIQREADRLQDELAGQVHIYEAKLTSARVEADQLQEKLRGSDLEVVEAKRKAREAQEALDKQRDKAQRLQDALSEANASAQAAEEDHKRLLRELEELRNRPIDVAVEVDSKAVEAARKAAIDEMTEEVSKAKDAEKQANEKRKAVEESLAAVQKELAEWKAKEPEVRELTQEEKDALTAEAVEKARIEGVERMQVLEKQLAQADPSMVAFKVLFDSWQDAGDKVMEALEQIKSEDKEKAERLKGAVRKVIETALEQMA